jgi:hypothetical protein
VPVRVYRSQLTLVAKVNERITNRIEATIAKDLETSTSVNQEASRRPQKTKREKDL